ncbi:MAG TPA: hypothetical protein VJL80_02255 [Aeromicrobium sp.]|nr:hypothetical protein [Aeromicrobium sp.]HKY56847.1 hypothetical protein [Aeromicrobium sp.]
MTQPKFPWALLVILAMFTFMAVSPVSPPWIVVFAIVAIIVTAAAAIYQVIPRKDDSIVDTAADPDAVPDQWSGEDLS